MDGVARLVVPIMSERLGRTIVIENRGGASGVIGTDAIAKAAPDGHSFGFVPATHSVNPSMMASLPFDTLRDLVPVGLAGGVPVIVAAHPDSPFRTLADVVAAGRRAGQEPAYGSVGNGSMGHLVMSQLQTLAGARFLHTPFRGGGPAVQALLANTVPLAVVGTTTVGAQVLAGRARGIAVSSAGRSPAFPDVPSIAESGFPGFSAESWVGAVAPAGTPAAAIERLNAELNYALRTEVVRTRMDALGMAPQPGTAAEFGRLIESDLVRWRDVVRQHNITAD